MTIAGIFDVRRPPLDAELDALVATTGGGSRTWKVGPLAVAWTDGSAAPGASSGVCAVLDGRLWDGPPVVPPLTELAGLRGDFVIVGWDERRESLTLARDQLGERSLVWHRHGSRLSFATDVRDLLLLLPSRPPPDRATMAHWLSVSGQPGDRTPYEGVHRLLPAHRLDVAGTGAPVTRRYWTPTYREPLTDGAAAVAAVRDAGATAVRRRSDGASTGVLLSGGLDSSSVAAWAADLGDRRPTRSYSATFPDFPGVDEGDLIATLNRTFALTGTRAVVRGGSVVAGAVEYVDRWDVPPPSPNLFFWLPLLRRAAIDGTTSLLDGEGGDEIFGLSPYLLADYLRAGRLRGAADLVRRVPGGGPHLPASRIRLYLREFGVKGAIPPGVHAWVRRRRLEDMAYLPPWLGAAARADFRDTDEATAWKTIAGPRWWAFLVEATTRSMAVNLLHDHVRRRGTMCGVEPRHPLYDVDLLECVLGLAPELQFDPRHSRPLLREAVEGRLPDQVRLRPGKSSFDAVFHAGLAGADLPVARVLLDPASALVGEYVDLGAVHDRLLRDVPVPAERQSWAIELWRLLTAECWLRRQSGASVAALAGVRLADAELSLVVAGS